MSMVVVVIIAAVVIFAVWYSMSNQNQANEPSAQQRITPQEYQATYAQRDHLLVDVRTAEEFSTGHIPGAKNIALQALPDQMATLSKTQPVVVYCRSGARSSNAAQMLTAAGFEQVYDLGGITRWREQGLPVN